MRPVPAQHCGIHPGQGIQLEEPEDNSQAGQAHLWPPHVRQVILFPVYSTSVIILLPVAGILVRRVRWNNRFGTAKFSRNMSAGLRASSPSEYNSISGSSLKSIKLPRPSTFHQSVANSTLSLDISNSCKSLDYFPRPRAKDVCF